MQVASTLWHDIKSQKILELQFRLKQTDCSPRNSSNHSRRAGTTNMDQTRQLRTAQQKKVGGGWRHGLAGQPP